MRTRAFKVGERVVFKNRRGRVGARVTKVQGRKRRVVTDQGERKLVSARILGYPQNNTFLMLETRLDRSLRSQRGQGRFIQEWVEAYGAKLLYERVHTREDLRRFLHAEGRRASVRLIHFCGHGHGAQGTISLTFEDIQLADSLDLFRGLKGKVILFSSCEIGRRKRIMANLVRGAGLAGIIAYKEEVLDTYANLADAMIYDRLILSHDSPRKIVKHVNAALRSLGTRCMDGASLRNDVLVCYD